MILGDRSQQLYAITPHPFGECVPCIRYTEGLISREEDVTKALAERADVLLAGDTLRVVTRSLIAMALSDGSAVDGETI